jgi:two-component system chemotaxis response regulator CheB
MSRGNSFIRVLVVDDSAVVQHLLRSLIDAEPDMVVVGTANDGRSALGLVEKLRPDLITMDVTMPGEGGIVTTQRIMATYPTPIAVVTAAPVGPDSPISFDALSAGAVDVIGKPQRGVVDDPARRKAFLKQLRTVAAVKVVGIRGSFGSSRPGVPARERSDGPHSSRPPERPSSDRPSTIVPAPLASRLDSWTSASLIAIGASTGGPPCVKTLLAALKPDSAPPVVLVQHMGRDFMPGFARWLDQLVRVHVELARPGLVIKKGHVYVAPGDRHLCVDSGGVLWLSDAPAVNHQRPAVDVLFESVAADCPAAAVGILLTGMGSDGARGLLAMREAGATTIAQDEMSCVVYGMPKAAADMGAAETTADPPTMARMLGKLAATPLISLTGSGAKRAPRERRGGT